MNVKLMVDETTQGYKKEYSDLSKLIKDVVALLDDHAMEISIKKQAAAESACVNDCANTKNTLGDYTKIVVETDEECPRAIAEITANEIIPADGYRVRLTPKYD